MAWTYRNPQPQRQQRTDYKSVSARVVIDNYSDDTAADDTALDSVVNSGCSMVVGVGVFCSSACSGFSDAMTTSAAEATDSVATDGSVLREGSDSGLWQKT